MNILLGVGVFSFLVSVTMGQGRGGIEIGGFTRVDPYKDPEAYEGLKKLLTKLTQIRGHPVKLPDLKAWVQVVAGSNYKYEWDTEVYNGKTSQVYCTAYYWIKDWVGFSKLFGPKCIPPNSPHGP